LVTASKGADTARAEVKLSAPTGKIEIMARMIATAAQMMLPPRREVQKNTFSDDR
jgi:hypothetical protein